MCLLRPELGRLRPGIFQVARSRERTFVQDAREVLNAPIADIRLRVAKRATLSSSDGMRLHKRKPKECGAKQDSHNKTKDHLLAHGALANIVGRVVSQPNCQEHHRVWKSKHHKLSARSGSIDKRREEQTYIDDESTPETNPQPPLSGRLQTQLMNKGEARCRAANAIGRVDRQAEFVFERDADDHESNHAQQQQGGRP